MALNLTCDPGPQAAAGFARIGAAPALVMYLDPGNLAIQVPPFPDGPMMLARFCRLLSREAARLADELDPQPGGRHTVEDPRPGAT